ncbi:MAG: T9SS type A sorting domain-containing protein [Bacteroidota bacterium]
MCHLLSAQTEIEPNGDPQTATFVLEDSLMSGVTFTPPDTFADQDGFVTYPSSDGRLVINFSFSSSIPADFHVRAYPAKALEDSVFALGRAMGNTEFQNTTGTTDSLVVHCVGLDSLYFLFSSGNKRTVNYQFSYRMIPYGTEPDPEPNNDREEAIEFLLADTVHGRIGCRNIVVSNPSSFTPRDANDYYYSVIPSSGQLRYYVEYYNHSDPNLATNADFTTTLLRAPGAVAFETSQITSTPLGPGKDTIIVDCLRSPGDTTYFRISPGNAQGCFSYSFYYEIIPPEVPNDTEPNDERKDAIPISLSDTLTGHIGYNRGSDWDQNDHFRFFGDSSKVRIWLELDNRSGDPEAEIRLRTLRDITPNLVQDDVRIKDLPLGKSDTTWITQCLEADSLILEVTGYRNECVSYRVFMERLNCQATRVDEELSSMSIYPNPARDHLIIEGLPAGARIRFRDLLGRKIQGVQTVDTADRIRVSLPGISDGIFFLEIQTEKGQLLKKILRQ